MQLNHLQSEHSLETVGRLSPAVFLIQIVCLFLPATHD